MIALFNIFGSNTILIDIGPDIGLYLVYAAKTDMNVIFIKNKY